MEHLGSAVLIETAPIDIEQTIALAEKVYERHKAIQDISRLVILRDEIKATLETDSEMQSIIKDVAFLPTAINPVSPKGSVDVESRCESSVIEKTKIAVVQETNSIISKTPSEQKIPKSKSFRSPKSTKPQEIYSWDGAVRREEADKDPDFVRMYLVDIGRTPLLTKEEEINLAQRMEKGHAAKNELNDSTCTLTYDEIGELLDVILDGVAAKKHFIQANLRLVVSIAKRYQGKGMELLDLIGEGNLGLEHAVDKFEWRRGFKFSTYATWWIRQAIQRGIADDSRAIRLPVHSVENLAHLQKQRIEFKQTYDREPSIAELSDLTGIDVMKVRNLLPHFNSITSLQTRIGEDGETELGDLVGDADSSSGYEDKENDINQEHILKVLSSILESNELEVLAGYFGFSSDIPIKDDQIGKSLGLTRERVRQIRQRALLKLKHPAAYYKLSGILPEDENTSAWKEKAACAGADVNTMFESPVTVGRPPKYKEQVQKPLKGLGYCDSCQIKQECRDYAASLKPHSGIWGGIVATQRNPIE